MVVYAWLSRQMDSNGQEDGRSTLKSISHGFTTTIEICRQKCSPGKWQATLSAPSRSDMTLDQARDVMSAELDLVTLAESELAFRRRGIVRDQVNLEVEESSLSPSA